MMHMLAYPPNIYSLRGLLGDDAYEGCFTSVSGTGSSFHRVDYSRSDFQFSGAVESGSAIYLGHTVRNSGGIDAWTMARSRGGGTVSFFGDSGPARIRGGQGGISDTGWTNRRFSCRLCPGSDTRGISCKSAHPVLLHSCIAYWLSRNLCSGFALDALPTYGHRRRLELGINLDKVHPSLFGGRRNQDPCRRRYRVLFSGQDRLKTPILELRSVTHVFADNTYGLRDVNLSIAPGSFVVLAGENGSGKTILMRHLNGLAKATTGSVLLNGVNILDNLSGARRRVGLVFQDSDCQLLRETVVRDVAFGPENLRLGRAEINRRVADALVATGLVGLDQRRPHSLSGGEKRRLAVAGVLAMHPDVLVLDEPFTDLDWMGSAKLITILLKLHSAGKTILLITHDLDKMLAHANRLILIEEGRIVADGTPEKLISKVETYGVRRPPGAISSMTWADRRLKIRQVS